MARPTRTKGKAGGKAKRQSIRDKARQAAANKEKGGGGLDTLKDLPRDIEFFKPKMGRGNKGKNHFSIVPYVVSIPNHPFQTAGELWHECTYWRHKIGNGTDQKSYICLAKTEQSPTKKCPICEHRAALIKSGDDPDMVEELKPKQRQLFNILDHDDEDKGIQLLEMSPYMFGFMLDEEDIAQEEDFPGRFYGDDQNGLSIQVRFNEESFGGNKFPEAARIDFEERDDLPEEMVEEQAVDLDACLRILTYDELNAKFFELEADENEDADPGEEPEEEGSEDPEEEREEGGDTLEDELLGMTRTELKRYITENNLDIKVLKKHSDQDIIDNILAATELPEEEPEQEEPEEPEEETEEEKKPSRRERKPKQEEEQQDDRCPHGFVFGVDVDTKKAKKKCDECDVWDDCQDEKDRLADEGVPF